MNTIETPAQYHALTLAFAESFKAQSIQLSNNTIAGCLANSAGYRNRTTALTHLPITLNDATIDRFTAFLSAKNKRNQLSENYVRAIIDSFFSSRTLSWPKNLEGHIAPLIAFAKGSKDPLPARIRLNLMTGVLTAEAYDPDAAEPAHSVWFPVDSDISGGALDAVFQTPVLMEAFQQIMDSFNQSNGSWENQALADGLVRIVNTQLETMLSGEFMDDDTVIHDQWEWADVYVRRPVFAKYDRWFEGLLGDSTDLESAVDSLREYEMANSFIHIVGDLKAAIENKAREEGFSLEAYFQEVREHFSKRANQ